jgi:hypothetical protein
MKNFVCQTLLLLLVGTKVWAQGQPKAIQAQSSVAILAAFQKAYPHADAVRWEKEGKNEYEVSFRDKGRKISAIYNTNAELLEEETAIAISDLPQPAQEYVKQHYTGKQIRETAKITKTGGNILYEVEVDKRDLLFDAKGGFVNVSH